MDSRINFHRPTGPTLPRKLGDRPPKREQTFVLPRNEPGSEDDAEPELETSANDSDLLSPHPRREAPNVSRVRSGDEAGQRIDVRG